VTKGFPLNHFGKLDGRKGANLGLWMVAKALCTGQPQKVAFPLYLAFHATRVPPSVSIRFLHNSEVFKASATATAGHE
jgi:hypothetical protein